MKKSILISILIFVSFYVMSQEKGSHISLWGGMGSSGFRYKMSGIDFAEPKRDILLGGQAGLEFGYYFTKNVGISIGAGISHYRTKVMLQGNFLPNKFFTADSYTDNDPYDGHITDYDLRVRTQNWTEYQSGVFIEIPLMLNLRKKFGKKESFGLYLSVGAKFQIPFSATYSVVDGEHTGQNKLMISGYYPEANLELGGFGGVELPQHAFGNIYNPSEILTDAVGNLNFKFNISAVAEAGILIALSRRVDLALGAFIDYGLLNINKTGDQKAMFTGPETDYISGAKDNIGNGITYNSILNSSYDANKRYADKVKNISYGGKVGLSIKLGKLSQREQQPQLTFAPYNKDTIYIYKYETQPVAIDSILKEVIDAIREMPKQKTPEIPAESRIEVDKNTDKEKDKDEDKYDNDDEESFPAYIPKENIDFLFSPIYFDLDKAVLTSESLKNLDRKVEILNKYPEIRLVIYGKTCDLGKDTYNYKLGQKRAEAARNYLISKGIAPERLESSTLSKFQPERPNTNEYNRLHNRRDDFKPVYQKK